MADGLDKLDQPPSRLPFLRRLMTSLTAACGLGVVLFLLLPLTVYSANLYAIDVPKSAILLSGGLLSLLFAVAMGVPCALASRVSWGLRFCQILTITVLALILFPNRTGEMAGFQEFLARADNTEPLLKLALLFLLTGWLAWRRPKALGAVSQGALVATLVAVVAIAFQQRAAFETAREQDDPDPAVLAELGTQTNVIVVVLDGFTGYRMLEILREKPEYARFFPGFTFYPHAVASALNTSAGISVLLSGTLEHALDVDNWQERNNVSLKESILTDACSVGLSATYLSFLLPAPETCPPGSGISVHNEQTFFDQAPNSRLAWNRVLGFWSVSLSRILPPTAYRRLRPALNALTRRRGLLCDRDLLDALPSPMERAPLASKLALAFLTRQLHRGDSLGRAIFIHSKISHPPYELTASGTYDPAAGFEGSSLYGVHALRQLLEKLETIGCYDSSLIIFTADHGAMPVHDLTLGGIVDQAGEETLGVNPLVMVKPPHARAPLRTSEMTIRLADVAATVRDLLGVLPPRKPLFPQRSLLLQEDTNRQLAIPLFFRPDQGGYHDALQKWVRIDLQGTFADYIRASLNTPRAMLVPGSHVRLFAGVDTLRTQNVAAGWLPGEGVQYGGTIEINGRLLAKKEQSGLLLLSVSGETINLQQCDASPEAIAALRQSAGEGNLLAAVGVRLSPDAVHALLPDAPPAEHADDLRNLVWTHGHASGTAPGLQIATNDASLEIEWK